MVLFIQSKSCIFKHKIQNVYGIKLNVFILFFICMSVLIACLNAPMSCTAYRGQKSALDSWN